MKKKHISLPVVLTGILTSALVGCTNVKKPHSIKVNGEEVHLKFNGNNLTAEELYQLMKKQNAVAPTLFTALQEYLIRMDYPVTDEIKDIAANEIKTWEDGLKTQAAADGTSYSELKASTLKSLGYDTVAEYRQSIEYKYQKERFETRYWDELLSKQAENEPGILESVEDYVDSRFPYHVKHILVKLSDAASNLDIGTISADEAKKLSAACTNIIDDSFEAVAINSNYNDDFSSDSADNLISSQGGYGIAGDLGIMDSATSFVDEFKLGTYVFDYITKNAESNYTATPAQIQEKILTNQFQYVNNDPALGELTTNYQDITKYVQSGGTKLRQIDKSVCSYLGVIADKTSWTSTETQNTYGYYFANSYNYPRNVVYNSFFNNHDVSLLTVGGHVLTGSNPLDTSYDAAFGVSTSGSGNTLVYNNGGTDATVVTDSSHNLIFVVRSTYGVHFITIEKSPFEADTERYYSLKDTPTGGEETEAFVANGKTTSETPNKYITTKQNTLNNNIKSYYARETSGTTSSEYLQYKIFDELYNKYKSKITFNYPDLQILLENYISNRIESKELEEASRLSTNWIAYYKLLQRQFYLEDSKPRYCLSIPKALEGTVDATSVLKDSIYSASCNEAGVPKHEYK